MADPVHDPREVFDRLHRWCRERDWRGYDPYDALSSRVYRALAPRRWRLGGIAWTQLVRRAPWNLRPLLGIVPLRNAKALGLFVSALVRRDMAQASSHAARRDALELAAALRRMRSPGFDSWCWGYPFDWHSRNFYLPAHAPNMVATVYAARAMIDLYDRGLDAEGLDIARGACRFILDSLRRTPGPGDSICFSYTAQGPSTIHNVNLLGASLMAQVAARTGEDFLAEQALRAVGYALACQRDDGSWPYGEDWKTGWIDSFHTGFNLEALDMVRRATDESLADGAIERGYRFYLDRFFRDDGAPAYYHNRLYPIDIHSAAQGLLTMRRLEHADPRSAAMRQRLMQWTLSRMLAPEGYFYARIEASGRMDRIPYMRWAQAWMLRALADDAEPERS